MVLPPRIERGSPLSENGRRLHRRKQVSAVKWADHCTMTAVEQAGPEPARCDLQDRRSAAELLIVMYSQEDSNLCLRIRNPP